MKVAYFDCFSGLSGDMVLGALLDVGVDFDRLQADLRQLPLTEYAMAAKPASRGGIGATKLSVKAVEKGIVRTFSNIRQIIQESALDAKVKERSLAVFQTLAEAQAKITKKNVETIHFHEVGAIDSIVDIVGSAIGFNLLRVDKIYCSPLPMGLGMARTDHGMMPIPSPVTLEILAGVPLYSTGISTELVTPTGAAIIRTYVDEFTNMPPMTVERTGYGAGREELEIPNILRLITGELAERTPAELMAQISAITEKVEGTARDDLIDKLINLGARDVWLVPVAKARKQEAVEVNVVAPVDKEEDLIDAILTATSADQVRVNRQLGRRRR